MVANVVVKPDTTGQVPIRLINTRPEPVTIHQGTEIAVLEELSRDIEISAVQAECTTEEATVTEEKCQMLWEMTEHCEENLSIAERKQVFALLLTYADIFANNKSDFGRTKKVQHNINTGASSPIRQHIRRIPPMQREEARKLLKDMMAKDVVQPSNSPWASP